MGGIVAGPLSIVVAVLQMVTRDGHAPSQHPLSLLSNGELGSDLVAPVHPYSRDRRSIAQRQSIAVQLPSWVDAA